jgi:iron-sulfur cluster repair protein YtfE (RIC family)
MTGTENIRQQNDRLRAGIASVAALRDQLGDLSPEQARDRLDQALAFFRHEVAPHARAEERVFYPEVSRVLGVDLGERMVGEHRYISELVADVTELRHSVAAEGTVPPELYGALRALVDVVEAHLRLEEEVLDQLRQRAVSDADMYFLYERMEEAEFDAVVELSAPRPTAGG